MDVHDLQSRSLLALVMADKSAVERFTTDFEDTDAYVEAWLLEQGHTPEKATWLAPYLRDAASSMMPVGATREAVGERRGPPRTDL